MLHKRALPIATRHRPIINISTSKSCAICTSHQAHHNCNKKDDKFQCHFQQTFHIISTIYFVKKNLSSHVMCKTTRAYLYTNVEPYPQKNHTWTMLTIIFNYRYLFITYSLTKINIFTSKILISISFFLLSYLID